MAGTTGTAGRADFGAHVGAGAETLGNARGREGTGTAECEDSALELFGGLPAFAGIERLAPADIEARSMELIAAELSVRGIFVPEEVRRVVLRCIHTTADFDFARSLRFSPGVPGACVRALREHRPVVVTDTNMALAGISRPACRALGIDVRCFMADGDVAEASRRSGLTRAACSVDKAAHLFRGRAVAFAVGNAPTALVRIRQLYDAGILAPEFVVGVPVGFVNVTAAKELIMQSEIPHIVAEGRKGGSTVAAAIMNALLYQARE